MANIQIGTNLRNCKITLAAEFYQPWGVLFSFQNNTTDVINSSSFTDTSIPGGMTVYDVNGSGIFSSVNINGFTSYGTLDATTFDIPNDKDYIVSTLDDGFTTATYEPLTSNIQIPITKNGKTTLATKGTKNVEDIDINVDIAPTIQSLSITPSETSQTFNASNVDGYKPVNVSAIQTETPSVDLSLASGNQTVNASSGKYIKSLTITKPSTLVASNIKSGVNIAGVSGSLSPAKPEQAKIITITENGTTTVTPDSGQVLSSVEITTNIPTYITVASESALPSTAQEGTIAVVEGVAMYSVSCSSYADKVDTALKTFYSINNGNTWTEFDSTGILSENITQIRFRMTYPDGHSAPGTPKILSEQLGMTLSHSMFGSGFDITSDNYILTENITDVTYNEDI